MCLTSSTIYRKVLGMGEKVFRIPFNTHVIQCSPIHVLLTAVLLQQALPVSGLLPPVYKVHPVSNGVWRHHNIPAPPLGMECLLTLGSTCIRTYINLACIHKYVYHMYKHTLSHMHIRTYAQCMYVTVKRRQQDVCTENRKEADGKRRGETAGSWSRLLGCLNEAIIWRFPVAVV